MISFYVFICLVILLLSRGLLYIYSRKSSPQFSTGENAKSPAALTSHAAQPIKIALTSSPNSGEIDYELLEKWYKNNSRQNSIGIKINVYMPLVLGIFSLFLYNQIQNSLTFEERHGVFWDRSKIEAKKSGAEVAVFTMLISLITFYIPLASGTSRLENIRNVVLKREQFQPLWEFIDLLSIKLNLPINNVTIFYLKTDRFEAHVEQKNNRVYLYLSRGLISHYSQNKEEVQAIIAHEFGHVFQKDTRFLLLSSKAFILPSILLTVGVVITLINGGTESVEFVAAPASTLGTLFILIGKRKKCEFMADLASVVFLRKTTIKEVLSRYMTGKVSLWYPSRDQRILHINQMLEKFQTIGH